MSFSPYGCSGAIVVKMCQISSMFLGTSLLPSKQRIQWYALAHTTLKYAALRYRKETSVRLHQSTIASADRPRAAAGGTSATCDRLRRAFPSSHDVQWLASGRPLAGTYFSSVFLLVDDAVINMVVVFCFGYDATVGWSSCSSPKNEATKFT